MMNYSDPRGEPYDGADNAVAIIGMSARFAQARGLDAYWSMLREGREAVQIYSEAELAAAGVTASTLKNPHYVRAGAPIEDMECFDGALFGLSPRDCAIMDPQHRHFLECTWEALENAGHTPHGFQGVIGMFAGSGHNAYMPYNLLTNRKLVKDVGLFLLRHTSNDKDFLSTRASYLFDLKGPSINLQTACSTSLVAIHMAAQSLLNGECDMAMAGGASIELPHRQGYMYEEGEILSPDGHCRPFDANSQGTVFGSGIGIIVLRRLADAVADGDHIYAVLRGSAINNDGAGKVGYLAPSVDGQAQVIAEALAVAGVGADTISYVETHGTGTPVGDPIEVAALTSAFRQTTDKTGFCAIGSVKSNIGHTDTAAGAAGVIKVALAMHHGEIPPTLHFTSPNPACGFETSPFHVQSTHASWQGYGQPRRAGVSSLGVGGTNAHVILEEAPPRRLGGKSRRSHLLLVSAHSRGALAGNIGALSDYISQHRDGDLADMSFTLSTGRRHLALRRFCVAADADTAIAGLSTADQVADEYRADRPVSFLFCGAGPQHVDMARDLYDTEPLFREEVDSALAVLRGISDMDLRRWLFPSEADRQAAIAQMERPSVALPALFIIQTALARFWMSFGIEPTGGMIGHSSGEYAAAHIAGVMDLEAGLRIVSARGRLFETTDRGAMLSVPLAESELCGILPPDLSIAAINAPRLCVASGPVDAMARFHEILEAQGVEAQPVRINVAAHSRLLDPILDEFRALMRTIPLHAPQRPMVSNLTGSWATASDVADPEYWVRHLRQTVRFTDGLEQLLSNADSVFLEVGPGRSMTSLARQHSAGARSHPAINSLRHADQAIADDATWLAAMGRLWASGVALDWNCFWDGQDRLRQPLPTYCFDRERHWIDPVVQSEGSREWEEDAVRRDDPSDWQFEPIWKRQAVSPSAMRSGTALILEDQVGLGQQIARRLRADGRRVVTVKPGDRFRRLSDDSFCVDPGSRCHFSQLLDCLSAEESLPAQVYHGWLVTGADGRQAEIDRELQLGFYSLLALAPELARQVGEAQVDLLLLTDHGQRIANENGLMPGKAAAIGAARVIPAEYPRLKVRSIDIAPPSVRDIRAVNRLIDMLFCDLGDMWEQRSIALRGSERWVQDFEVSPTLLSPGGAEDGGRRKTYLITGGLGGLGLTIARHLAETPGTCLALISRSSLPPREDWCDMLSRRAVDETTGDKIRKLLALEDSGANVEVIVADVADPRSLRRAVRKAISRFGQIDTVLHTAGALDDGLIETKDRAAMDAVLRPKVAGTLALGRALQGQNVRDLILFSSISAFAGMAGQADYAAANAFLDAYAESRREDPDMRVMSVGWCRWREVGMAANLASQMRATSANRDIAQSGESVDHPILERLHAISEHEFIVSAVLSPETHWMLDEHRVSGIGAILPGTAYLELARAAYALIDSGPIILSDVTFLTPFAVPDGAARELRVHMRRRVGSDWRFAISGRTLGGTDIWTEHATGFCSARNGMDRRSIVQTPLVGKATLADMHEVRPSAVLNFGPRWNLLRTAKVHRREAVLDLRLDPSFASECERLPLHPALLDIAIAGAQMLIPGYDPDRNFFAPFSYRRFILHDPLPDRIISHVRYRPASDTVGSTAIFDVTITNADGRILVEVDGFTMIHVASPTSLGSATRSDGGDDIRQGSIMEGILPEEGLRTIDLLLAGRPRPHVLISPYDLRRALDGLRDSHRKAHPVIERSLDGEMALPETEMEHVIADLWSDLLGVSPVLRTDDFFALGGHSLLAVQFANRLRKKTGQSLPLAALLETPTVAQLATLIAPDSRISVASSVEPMPPPPVRDHVVIRDGGASQPLFMIHDGLGETLLYRGLALRLDQARPIYGIEPLRTATGEFAHTSITEMAANYVQRVRRLQPIGPYFLAGLCAGGVIAFEMARQLQDAGETVAFVGIIDAADVELKKRPFYVTRKRLQRVRTLLKTSDVFTMIPALMGKAGNMIRWEIMARIQKARDRKSVQIIRQQNDGTSGAGMTAGRETMSFLKLYEVAHRQHRPTGVFAGGTIALFKAMEGNGHKDDIPYSETFGDYALGWGRRVADDITVLPVPGGHSSALQEPNVDMLATCFQDVLDCATSWVEPIGEQADGETSSRALLVAAE